VRRLSLLAVLLVGPYACTPSTTVVRLAQPNAYRIECLERSGCHEKAEETCGPKFTVVREWQNPISESDLPGPHENTERTGVLGPTRAYPKQPRPGEPSSNAGPTFESLEPLGMTELEVICMR